MTKSNKQVKESKKPQRDFAPVRRAIYIVMFSGCLATSAYLAILVSSPDAGQYTLAGFNAINAAYFLSLAIK